MGILSTLRDCLGLPDQAAIQLTDEKSQFDNYPLTGDAQAEEYVNALRNAPSNDLYLKVQLNNIIKTEGFTEWLAEKIFNGMTFIVEHGLEMGEAMKSAYEKAKVEAERFVTDHPIVTALIVVGILIALAPWVLEALGFVEYGIVEGSFAARWMATFGGFVPKGSIFSFFQRMGMIWRRRVVSGIKPWQ